MTRRRGTSSPGAQRRQQQQHHQQQLRISRPILALVLLGLVLLAAKPADAESKCLCQASGCLCCVELNLTSSIDLGGPACVNVRQRERNVTLNLSYADNPVHNATIGLDQAARKPTCMNLLSDLAQICAEFISMRTAGQPDRSGYDGCLVIEPALLGAPQATYPVGCFNFDRGQVRQIEGQLTTEEESKPGNQDQESDEEDEEEGGLNAEELIAAVSASAEQGIALFSQWLGLNLGPRLNVTSVLAETSESGGAERPVPVPNAPATSSRHGRMISILGESEDKNEERFKQLLSAQDNILKESATIGKPSNGMGTAFLYSHPDTDELRTPNHEATISPENLAVVPSESRRGGRAYNIHQHVNEV